MLLIGVHLSLEVGILCLSVLFNCFFHSNWDKGHAGRSRRVFLIKASHSSGLGNSEILKDPSCLRTLETSLQDQNWILSNINYEKYRIVILTNLKQNVFKILFSSLFKELIRFYEYFKWWLIYRDKIVYYHLVFYCSP